MYSIEPNCTKFSSFVRKCKAVEGAERGSHYLAMHQGGDFVVCSESSEGFGLGGPLAARLASCIRFDGVPRTVFGF